ncbi:MAG: UDP-N-acetylglucosamine 2-epimerase (non-hydrolyzing), partial [Chlorobi bacterium]|nr:UDP-N-acetylglucosamine 2-epimerase (non-hydrolyzing) [Chlorobiota bacterium]
FGTRPEAIKMAPVVQEFKKYQDVFLVKVCVTAQHRGMLDQVLEIFKINPEYDLNLMKPNQDLYDITSRALLKLRAVLNDFKPNVVLVHGDTTTSATASLAAFYKQIPVGHVEAGLRTGNIYSPWPEEVNRKITGAIATFHFAPTQTSKNNLIKENIDPSQIAITGNTVIDALFLASKKIKENPYLQKEISTILRKELGENFQEILESRYFLVTGHRRENFGDGIINICQALKQIAMKFPKVSIIYPVHLNPNVYKPVFKLLSDLDNVHLINPLSYLPFVFLLEKSYIVLTDSGGLQEEAPSFGKPVLVMRDTTERPEAINAGTVKLVGTDKNKIFAEASRLLNDQNYYLSMAKTHNPYGDGSAAKKIVSFLKKEFQ